MKKGYGLNLFKSFLTLIPFIFLFTFTASSAFSGDKAKIGALMPMTGGLQAYGKSCLTGIKLAVEQINKAGGVLGSELVIKLGDTQTSPQMGTDAAHKLVSIENVFGIVGALSSGVTIPVAQSISSTAKIPQISPASTTYVITDLEDKDFLFRSVPSDDFQGVALAQVVTEAAYKVAYKNIAIIYLNNDYGQGLAESFQAAYEKSGGQISVSIPYEPGNASYRGELTKAASKKADALLLIAYPENGITILKQAIEGRFFTKFVFTDGLKAPEIIDALGAKFLNGSFGTSSQAMKDTDAGQLYDTAYQKRFGEAPPKPYIDTAYDAAFVLALAAEKAGSLKGKEVKEQLRAVANEPGEVILPGEWAKAKKLIAEGKDIQYMGASGSIDFDDKGDVAGTFAHWKIEDGKIKTVKVFEPEM